jgi:hypothetical protein
MSKRSLRHVSFSEDPLQAAKQAAENARDANVLFPRKLDGYLVRIPRYAARATTGAKIQFEQALGTKRPSAVVLVRVCETNDPGGDLAAVGRPNFYHDAKGIGVYEPSGLTADTKYDLTFLVLE